MNAKEVIAQNSERYFLVFSGLLQATFFSSVVAEEETCCTMATKAKTVKVKTFHKEVEDVLHIPQETYVRTTRLNAVVYFFNALC